MQINLLQLEVKSLMFILQLLYLFETAFLAGWRREEFEKKSKIGKIAPWRASKLFRQRQTYSNGKSSLMARQTHHMR